MNFTLTVRRVAYDIIFYSPFGLHSIDELNKLTVIFCNNLLENNTVRIYYNKKEMISLIIVNELKKELEEKLNRVLTVEEIYILKWISEKSKESQSISA
ncbi:hypothetical protein [Halalkalibacter akibai]|uniref:hypothetical protein n=1 Tax=Halalkalibacter akibai TaxID=1411 RepID=UPI000550D160|nr:hypothetical protein [Halalkalibacter akibai]